MARVPELSIIIPVRNEEQTIAGILRSLSRQDRISDCQVIVVDGGSTDGTASIAQAFPFVELTTSAPGLSRQMNRGSEIAEGNTLWFLHADTTLPNASTIAHVIAAMEDTGLVGGACHFELRGDDLYFRLINSLVNVRARLLRRPYGDQGIFVRRSVFKQLGGYRQTRCADLDLVMRMRKIGPIRILSPKVATSARTWYRYGKLKTTFWHLKEWISFELNKSKLDAATPAPAPDSVPRGTSPSQD